MYDVDDAVAKVDGYVISVRRGGPMVGEKRMVRIETARRTNANAVLLDLDGAAPERPVGVAPAPVQADASVDGEDVVDSKPRRRGRRGGRRRSRATAESAPEETAEAATSETT
jgi:ribonuclease G